MPFPIGPDTRRTDHLEPHRRVSSTLDKEVTPLSSVGGESPDIRFVPSLAERPSDSTLDRIREGGSGTEMAPTHYRFSPPTTPAIQAPSAFIPLDATTPSGALPPLSSPTAALPVTSSSLLLRPSVPPTFSSPSAPSASNAGPAPSAPPNRPQAVEFADGPVCLLLSSLRARRR
jgi:hypothetical protein